MGLKGKYVLFTVCVLVAVIGLFEYNHLRSNRAHVLEESRLKATLVAETIKSGLTAVMLSSKQPAPQKFFDSLMNTDEVETLRLQRLDGTIIASSNVPEVGSVLPLKPGEDESSATAETNGMKQTFSVQMPLYNERRCRNCHTEDSEVLAVLTMQMDELNIMSRIRSTENRTVAVYLVAFAILSASMGFITWRLVTRPLKEMTDTMRRVGDGDPKTRYITGRTDEIGDLSEALNNMLFELDKTHKELEKCHTQDMQHAEKLATVGELAAAIAHDIKNPLAGISGAIQVFAEDFSEDDPRKEIIKETLLEIDRLDRSVKDLLSYARPPEPLIIKVPLEPVIEHIVLLLTGQAKKQDVEIAVSSTGEVKEINVDPDQIQQVFLNIMINAIHSMPEGGKLTVSTSHVAGTGMAEINITDTGMGIAKHNLANIFMPFFTTKHTGTGLGLAISKNTVEKHGGKLLVESRTGVGSTFKILLPWEVPSA